MGFTRRVGDAGKIAVAVDGERGTLAEGRNDGGRVAAALDPGFKTVEVLDSQQPPFRIVEEFKTHGAGERIERPQMSSVGVEVIQLGTVLRWNPEVAGAGAGKHRAGAADAIIPGVRDTRATV